MVVEVLGIVVGAAISAALSGRLRIEVNGGPNIGRNVQADGGGDRRRTHGVGRRARERVYERSGAVRRCIAQCRQLDIHDRRIRGWLRCRSRRTKALAMTLAMNLADSLIVAFVIGTAFGCVLEQAGLGDAKRLAGQFYLRDFTVLKVMFSAIVTAMLGAFWLGRFGLARSCGRACT